MKGKILGLGIAGFLGLLSLAWGIREVYRATRKAPAGVLHVGDFGTRIDWGERRLPSGAAVGDDGRGTLWARTPRHDGDLLDVLRAMPSKRWDDPPHASPIDDIMRLRELAKKYQGRAFYGPTANGPWTEWPRPHPLQDTRWAGKWLEGPHIADNIQQDKGGA